MSARDMVQIVARFGDTLVDAACVVPGARYRLGVTELVAGPGVHRVGLVEVTMSPIARPRRLAYAMDTDRRTLPYLACSLVAHVVLCILAITTPPDSIGGSAGTGDRHASVARVGWRVGPPGGSTALALRDSAPSAPHRDARRRSGRPRTADAERVTLAALAGLASSIAAPSVDVAGSFDGAQAAGDGDAGFGGSRGDGGGGGEGAGIGPGSMADGRYGTRSDSGAQWLGAGSRGSFRARESGVPTVILCGGPAPCVASGDLDKAIVRRYIRRQLARIQYCYEKALLADATIAGTVAIDFVIGPDGDVVEMTATGVQPDVASCVGNVVRAIRFPRSVTRTATRVRYPFELRTSGN